MPQETNTTIQRLEKIVHALELLKTELRGEIALVKRDVEYIQKEFEEVKEDLEKQQEQGDAARQAEATGKWHIKAIVTTGLVGFIGAGLKFLIDWLKQK